jgi:folate-dependent phosphoribosylglycinamide formyltransferase PurN
MKPSKIVLMAGEGLTTNILYNALNEEFNIEKIILEEPVSKKEFLKKRIKNLGMGKVSGQVLFQIFMVTLLNFFSTKRKKEILQQYHLKEDSLPDEKIIPVKSVNNPECMAVLQKINPDVVVVIGTRIISKQVLSCISAKFINIHAGITPKYRNVHGAYWALVNDDEENCGVTVHLVDPGIDTGSIIYQSKISITPPDNFVTYPLLQLAEGIACLKMALQDIAEEKLVLKEGKKESKIWHHPTLWQYLYNRIVHNKK